MGAELSVRLLFAHVCMLKPGWPLGLNMAKREPGSLQHLAFTTSSGCWKTCIVPQQGAAYLHQIGISFKNTIVTAIDSPICLVCTANAPAEFHKSTWIQNEASYRYNSGAICQTLRLQIQPAELGIQWPCSGEHKVEFAHCDSHRNLQNTWAEFTPRHGINQTTTS